MARLKILSDDDYNKLYKIPSLTDDERKFVFDLDEKDKIYLNNLKNVSAKINYILTLGYFRISQYFFSFTFRKSKEDVHYILSKYFPTHKFPTKDTSQHQYYANRRIILEQYNMETYSKPIDKKIRIYLSKIIKQHAVPKYLFDSVLDYCNKNKIIRPIYSTLQKLIADACSNERTRISNKLYKLMDNSTRIQLNELLKKNDFFYNFTLIKKDQKDFSTTEIKSSIEKTELLRSIYKNSQDIIKGLELSPQNILYYAKLAERYTVYQLRTLTKTNLARIYLICYVHIRFLKINDHLIASFIQRINGYKTAADKYQKEEIYNAQIIDNENRNIAAKILSLNIDKKIDDKDIRSKSFEIIPKDNFQHFVQKIRKPHLTPDYYRWQYYTKHEHAIKRNIRLIFRTLDFESTSSELIEAISFLKSHFNSNKSFSSYQFKDIPLEFIPATMKRYVITRIKPKNSSRKEKTVLAGAYEFMLYSCIENLISKGIVTIKESLYYKSLEDELIPLFEWNIRKDKILGDVATQLVTTNIKSLLQNLEPLLTTRYQEVNKKIKSGSNTKINIKYHKNGDILRWNIPYKKLDDNVNNPYYDSMDIASISNIFRFTNHHTNFLNRFSHILPSYVKSTVEGPSLFACIVAKATGNDIYRMKDISDIGESLLSSTYSNFVREQTLISASDEIINKLSALPIFKEYTLAEYGIHASVDGQKLETRYNTIQARYSSKYYGLGKGVSAYTLFANCLPLRTKIIGSNEHESHYLLDALRSNSSDVEITAISGDMHSINRVNFILLYMFGYKFMPRFTKLDKKVRTNLVSFDDPSNYNGCLIQPAKKINKALIQKEEDNILRVLSTLALKENTQSNIVRKLSSNKSNDTMKALMELNKIIMSLYLLDYVDDEEMRQCVHRSLNRGESYHQLRAAIARIGGRKLIGKTDIELAINNECARLMAICIIFYNAFLLSKIYEYCKTHNLINECNKIVRLSPVAWQHINFVGRYEFTKNEELLNIDNKIEHLIKNLDQVVLIIDTKKSNKLKR